jgi:two-component system sensor histidine kinase YesM
MATILMSGTALILLLILLLVGALTYHSTRLSIQRRFMEQYSQMFNQLDGQLTASVQRIARTAAALNANTELIGAANLARAAKSPAVRAQNENIVRSILKTAVGYQPYVDNAGIYLKDMAIMMFGGDSAEYMTRIPSEAWLQSILRGEAREVLSPNYQMRKYQFVSNSRPYYRPYFLYARSFNDSLVSSNKGVLLISLEQAYLSDLLGEATGGDGSIVALLDKDGEIIFSRGGADEQALEAAVHGARGLNTGDILPVGEHSRFLIRQENESLGWNLIALIPEDVMYQEMTLLQTRIVTGTLCALALGFLMILFISRTITRPFRTLMQSMARAGEGDLRLSLVKSPIREIDELAGQYNSMLERIASLIARVRSGEEERRASEMAALRSQINPHFTYNTLDSIRWMAMMQNAPKVAEMITSLVRLLKLTTGRKGEFVRVAEEFEQVARYTEIIRFRYNCRIDVSFEIEPGLEGARTLGFLLQPIVENSFVHGFENFERPGWVRVSARAEGATLVLTVEDNGRGMSLPEGELPPTTEREGEHLHTGIGISNVNSRVKSWFGEGYGVAFKSSLDAGTTVALTQPLVLARSEEKP